MIIKHSKFALFVIFSWSFVDFLASAFTVLFAYSATIKLAFFLPLLLLKSDTVITRHYFLIIVIFGMSILLFLAYPDSFNSRYSSRMFGFVLVFLVFYYSLKNIEITKIMKMIFFIIGMSFASSVISVFTGENSVYDPADGFGGGSGGFYSANQYSYFLIILISTVLVFMSIERKNQNFGSYAFLFIGILNCFILSTKSSLAFALLVLLLLIVTARSWFLVGLMLASAIWTLVNFYDELAVFNRFLFFMVKYDFIWALTSGRSERVDDFYSVYSSLIPGENKGIFFEMELFDSIANLGFAGLVLVLGFFGYAINRSLISLLALIIVFFLISIILLSGHFFTAVAIAPFFAVYFNILDRLRNVIKVTKLKRTIPLDAYHQTNT